MRVPGLSLSILTLVMVLTGCEFESVGYFPDAGITVGKEIISSDDASDNASDDVSGPEGDSSAGAEGSDGATHRPWLRGRRGLRVRACLTTEAP